MSQLEPKTPMNPTIVAAWIGFAGAILAALIAGFFAIYTAGKKANEASDRPITLFANLEAGFTLINPSKPASDSFQQTKEVSVLPPVRQTAPQPTLAPDHASEPTEAIKVGTCSGLDNKTWAIQIAPVAFLKSKDNANHELSGYNINLRLSNNSDRSLYLKHTQAELTDDQGNQLTLSSTTLPPDNFSAPNEVSAGADLPVNLKFLGQIQTGKSVSFSVTIHMYTQDDKPRIDKYETVACTNMPLQTNVTAAASKQEPE